MVCVESKTTSVHVNLRHSSHGCLLFYFLDCDRVKLFGFLMLPTLDIIMNETLILLDDFLAVQRDTSKYWVGDELLKVMFPGGISYEKLSDNTLENSIDLLSYQFAHYEPMCICLKAVPDDLKKIFRAALTDSYNYTYIAKETATDKVIAVLAGNEFKVLFHSNYTNIVPYKLSPLEAMISELEDVFVSRKPECLTNKTYFYIYALGVARKYVDTGVAIKLSLLLEGNLIKSGFTDVIAVASVKSVQKLLVNSYGFKEVQRAWCENFTYNEHTVFKDIEHTQYCALYHHRFPSC